MNPNRNWLLLAAVAAFVVFTGQIWKWHNLQVDPAGLADRPNITFSGNVTGAAFVGAGDALTGVEKTATNWWAVFLIEDPAAFGVDGYPRWTDITLQGWTNGPLHQDGSEPVFAYTTTDPALNGTPSWEKFTTNWYPRAFYCQSHVSWDITWLAMWRNIKPTYAGSIQSAVEAWDPSTDASYPYRWAILVRDTNAWFHPTNGLAWAYMLQNNTATPTIKAMDNATVLSQGVWYRTIPMWVTYDPRPKRFQAFDNLGADLWVITNQHQKP